MFKMRAKLRQKAINLRVKRQLSYSAIKQRLGVSKSTLSYWLQEYPLTAEKILELRRRGWEKGEASREKYRLTMRKRRESLEHAAYAERHTSLKNNLSKQNFYVAGLMLYLAEGGKRNPHTIVLANTDARLIKFFIKWLQEFLALPPSSLRAQLHLYENMDLAEEKRHWQKQLGLTASQFYPASVRKLKTNSFSYSSTQRHGTCGIYSFSVVKKRELMAGIKAFIDIYVGLD